MPENKMKDIYLDKVVINIGIGQNENTIENATALIKKLTNHEAMQSKSKKRDPELKLKKGQIIGAVATLRKSEAKEFLRRALDANGNLVNDRAIARNSLNFGVKEYIYFTGVKYDHKIGILGLNVNAAFARKGRRVETRKRKASRVGLKHREIGKDDIKGYLQKNFNVKIAE